VDEFSLVQPIDGFVQGVIVTVVDAQVLRSPVGMVEQRPIHAVMVLPHALNLRAQLILTLGAMAVPRWIALLVRRPQ